MLSKKYRLVTIMAMAVTLLTGAVALFVSEGFCSKRHNGLYCHTGTSQLFLSCFLACLAISLLVGFFEVYSGKKIVFLKSNLSMAIALLSMPLLWLSMYFADPNA
ncbi:hypothetical protein [Microbulbifer sp. ALW1]|uniref:hypothetical protein n=1 Tax=Microbulbifer sp. (strain ALW1) TaxID=1516059 RepID=UPI001357FFF9|nr:hypothetical protein [Microbulbifer sp. ALW1]